MCLTVWMAAAAALLGVESLDWTARPPNATLTLEGETHHVQGIALDNDSVWVSANERATQRAWLFEFDRKTGKRLRETELTFGRRGHPGGMSLVGGKLWIPVAEARDGGSSVIVTVDTKTLARVILFEVPDHIGAITVQADRVIGVNWDARHFFEWSRADGSLLRKRPNPTPGRYQDMKFQSGELVVSGLEAGAGVVRWMDPETLEVRRQIRFGRTSRNVVFTNEGMDIDKQGTLYLLPEDAPSRLFIFPR
jgi:hypothetical protein